MKKVYKIIIEDRNKYYTTTVFFNGSAWQSVEYAKKVRNDLMKLKKDGQDEWVITDIIRIY